MPSSPRPPSRIEIVVLPAAGLLAIHLLRSRENELQLFFAPFLIVAIRMFLAQLKVPSKSPNTRARLFERATRRCIACNQIALLVLLMVETSGILAGGKGVPVEFWALVAALFVLYVALRLLSRSYWMAAAAANLDTSANANE